MLAGSVLAIPACRKQAAPPSASRQLPSAVAVAVRPGGPVVVKTAAAEFEVLPSGYVKAFLLRRGERLTLDDPETAPAGGGGELVIAGKEAAAFSFDLAQAQVAESQGRLGPRGKRVELRARSAATGLEKSLVIEVYDDFPNLAIVTAAYKNVGLKDVVLDRVAVQPHRLNASLADAKAPPYHLWSFHGSSYEWGKDEVVEISKSFSRPNVMGAISPSGAGGGIPLVAFWTASVGEAFGHVETLPLVLSMPVRVDREGRIDAELNLSPNTTLKPGEVYTTPRTFLAVYSGDYYEPLNLYSGVLQREGWTIPKPTEADYNANWCSWGYRSDVTPAQMLGTIPKLKELNIKWATLDYRWFDNFGDWNARPDTFPGDSTKEVVGEFHNQGIKVQLWWLPLAVSDGQFWEPIGPEETTPEARRQQKQVPEVVQQHPDWLILGKNGKHARLFLNRAALCPALPEVQEYHRKLTEKFLRDWGFDGSKLDMCFTVPACYNPRHRHKSPDDSIYAMARVFRVIFETTREIRPESVTQICPCGTTPNTAWLPYMDQAVTADPVGAAQVRRRIKMYKALLGPQAAVYGDHVELSDMRRAGKEYRETGKDFASTVGAGGVVGTKFVWPDPGPKFENVLLTPEKEAHWKRWIDIYNAKMLSRGTFLNLYVTGYDSPEGYAIEKDGKMYYAFFASQPSAAWKGQIELRGLEPGKYRVFDYVNGKELGTIDSLSPRLVTELTGHLLLEVSKL
jgi:alpha-galactosidase